MRVHKRDGGALVLLMLMLLALMGLIGAGTQLGHGERAPLGVVPALVVVPTMVPSPLPAPEPAESATEPDANPRVFAEVQLPSSDHDAIPSPPVDLRAEPGPTGFVVLTWQAAPIGAAAAAFEIRRDSELVYEGAETSFTDEGVRPRRHYCWEVRALSVTMRASAPVSACSQPRDVAPPSVPLNVAARLLSDDAVELSWAESYDETVPASS